MHEISSSLVISFNHLINFHITVFKSFYCSKLAVSRCTHNCKLMKFSHLAYNFLWTTRISKSPPCHCKCFRKTINNNSSLLHPWKTSYWAMLSIICKRWIYLIWYNIYILLNYDRYKLFKLLPCHNSTCWIIRKWHNKYLSLICYTGKQLFLSKLELILFL